VLHLGGSTVVVYALAVIATAAFRLFRPAHSALLPGLCNTPFELSSANVVRGLLDSLTTLLGPLAAALLLDLSTPAAVFVTSAGLSLASAVLLLGLSYERPPRARPQPLRRIAHETVEGFRALARYPDAGLLIGLALVQALTQGFLYVFVVVIAFDLLGMGASGVGLLTGAVGAGAVASSLGASTFVTGRRLATLEGIGVMLWGLPLTLSGALPHEPVVLGLMCVIGIGNALVDIGLHTLPARLVPEELLARVFGAKASLTALSIAVGSFVTPLVIDLLGIRGALILLGLAAPVAAALAWRHLYAIDAAIAHRDKEIDVLNDLAMFRPLPMPAIDEPDSNAARRRRLRRDRPASGHAAHCDRARTNGPPALHARPAAFPFRSHGLRIERARGGRSGARPAQRLQPGALNRWPTTGRRPSATPSPSRSRRGFSPSPRP
jgi:hypothetical protein